LAIFSDVEERLCAFVKHSRDILQMFVDKRSCFSRIVDGLARQLDRFIRIRR